MGGEPVLEEVTTPGLTTVPEVAEFLGVTPQQMLKTLIYDSDKEELVAVAIRGDREVNEVTLANQRPKGVRGSLGMGGGVPAGNPRD